MTKLKVQLYWKNNTPMNNKIGTQYYDMLLSICHTNLYDIVIVSESVDKQSLCRRTSRVIVRLNEFGANVAG